MAVSYTDPVERKDGKFVFSGLVVHILSYSLDHRNILCLYIVLIVRLNLDGAVEGNEIQQT